MRATLYIWFISESIENSEGNKMSTDLLHWWKSLNHNHKKVFIANYDFHKSGKEFKSYYDALYDQYYSTFGLRIRERLDNFEANEYNIQQIISICSLTIGHIDFNDFSLFEQFHNLSSLHFTNHKVVSLSSLKNLTIKNLTLGCGKLKTLNGIENLKYLETLKLSYCYELSNLNPLVQSSSIKRLDLNDFGRVSAINQLFNIDEIVIQKNMMYPREIEHTLYKYRQYFNQECAYRFDLDEIEQVLQLPTKEQTSTSTGSILPKRYYENVRIQQIKNFVGLIQSGVYSVYVKGFNDWVLKKNT